MRIILYSPVCFEKWDWRSCDKGIGGSETSHIQMAKELAKLGHEVITYAPLPEDVLSGSEWEGTKWYRIEDVDWTLTGFWMLYRCPDALDNFTEDHPGQAIGLLYQDWDYVRTLTDERLKKLNRNVVLCRAHENFLLDKHPAVAGKTWITRNGIRNDLIRETEAATKAIVPLKFGFDWGGALECNSHLRQLARDVFAAGHEVHIIPAIGPPFTWPYEEILKRDNVPYTAIHRVKHGECPPEFIANAKIDVMERVGCHVLYDDLKTNIDAVNSVGLKGILVRGNEPVPRDGIDYGAPIVRNPKRIMFASSPDRGLKAALKIFQRAKEFVPDLELHATYGYNNINKLIAQGATHFQKDKDECLALMDETGAMFHGRLTQQELYQEWLKTGINVYCTTFAETGYITGLESMALGAIPVFSRIWAQGENINWGIPLYGHPDDPAMIARAAAEVVRLATDLELQDRIRVPMMADTRARWGWEMFAPGWVRAAEQDLNISKTVVQSFWDNTKYGDKSYRGEIKYEVHTECADNDDEVDARRRWLDLAAGDIFLDIGACDGSWSLPAAALGATVYAIEPSCAAYTIDRLAKKNGFPCVHIERAFITDIDKGEKAYVAEAPEISGFKTRTREEDSIPITTIDQLVADWGAKFDRLDFVKIDIEGGEVRALKGAVESLKKFKPRLMIEVHWETIDPPVLLEDVTGFLDSLGLGYKHEPVERTHEGKRYWHLYSETK